MNIYPVTQNDFSSVITLLKQNDLPTEDLTDTTHLFALYEEDALIGTVGLEYNSQNGLLRSLSTSPAIRGTGGGKLLVQFIENFAKEKGVHTLYLLTTTAAEFFDKRNYQRINREEVPEFIKQTSEFSSICPSSATVMKKVL
jgi:amino-acid N-acetyltransferase